MRELNRAIDYMLLEKTKFHLIIPGIAEMPYARLSLSDTCCIVPGNLKRSFIRNPDLCFSLLPVPLFLVKPRARIALRRLPSGKDLSHSPRDETKTKRDQEISELRKSACFVPSLN